MDNQVSDYCKQNTKNKIKRFQCMLRNSQLSFVWQRTRMLENPNNSHRVGRQEEVFGF